MKAVNEVRSHSHLKQPLELSRWQKVVFPLILWFVHHILNVVTSLWLRLCHVRKVCLELSLPKMTITQISDACKTNLTKIPNHVAFGFLEKENNFTIEKVATLVSGIR